MLKASIDIGSNSVLLLIAECDTGNVIERYGDAHVTGLGRGMGQGLGQEGEVFCAQSMEETMQVLREYCNRAKSFNIATKDILVTATEASRVAQNAPDFFNKVKKELGLNVQIITAKAEAYFASRGVLLGQSYAEDITILDVGGASTEVTKVQIDPFEIINSISFPMGSVRCREWQERGSFEQNYTEITQRWNWPGTEYYSKELVCIAGTMTALAAIDLKLTKYSDQLVHGHIIAKSRFQYLLDYLKKVSPSQLLQAFPHLGKRANNLLPGALLAYCLGESLGVEFYKISVFGLRHGVLIDGSIRPEFLFQK